MSNDTSTQNPRRERPDDGVALDNKRAHLPWGTTLLTCPVCDHASVEIVHAEVLHEHHDDGRPSHAVGLLVRCHGCNVTFRVTFQDTGIPQDQGGHGRAVLMEHWDSRGLWS